MNTANSERIELMRIEVERLHELLASLDRDRAAVPRLTLFALAALPAGYLWGWTGVCYSVAGTTVLVLTALYIIGVRRNEYLWNLRALEAQLRDHAAQ